MPLSAHELLEAARELNSDERDWLLQALQGDEFSAWQTEIGEAEPGYDEWFRAQVQVALDDDSPGIPHEQVVQEMSEILRAASERERLKTSA